MKNEDTLFQLRIILPCSLAGQASLWISIVFLLTSCSATQKRVEFYVPMGHSKPVISVDVSLDSRYAASGSNDFSIKLWELSTGREIRTIHAGSTPITAVAFSPNGQLLQSGHADGTTILWELSTGKMIRKLKLHRHNNVTAVITRGTPAYGQFGSGRIHAVGFSDDGRMAISSGRDGYTKVLEVSTGKHQAQYSQSQVGNPQGTTISPNGRYAMVTGRKQMGIDLLTAWDLKKSKRIADIDIHRDYYLRGRTEAISSDGKTAVISLNDGSIEIWDLERSHRIRTVASLSNMIRYVVFSNSSKQFICIHNKDISLWDSRRGKKVREISLGSSRAYSGVFVPGDRRILVGTGSGTLDLYDLDSGNKIRSIRRNAIEAKSVAINPTTGALATGTETGEVHMWDTAEGRNVRRFRSKLSPVLAVAFSNDGRIMLSGQKNGNLRIWDTSGGKLMHRLQGHRTEARCVTLTPDRRSFLSAGTDKLLVFWDLATGKKIRVFSGHTHTISDIAVTPDSKIALTSSYDGTVRFWDLQLRNLIRKVEIGSGWVQCLSIHPAGNFAVAGSYRKITLIDIQSGKITKQIQLHDGYVNDVAISPDGKYIYTTGEDYLIHKWNIQKQSLVKTIKGHTNVISSIAVSTDGNQVITCSQDLTTRIWNAYEGDEIVRLLSSVDGEWIIATPDGHYDTSPEGTALVRWAFPGIKETFSFEQFEYRFHRPEIIRQRLAGDQIAGRTTPKITIPPVLEMSDHQTVKALTGYNYKLDLEVSSPDTVKTVRIYNNGKALSETLVNAKEKKLSLSVRLFSGANRITAIAFDENGFSSNPRYVDIVSNASELSKSNLYILSIGSSNYPNMTAKWQLSYAHTDAHAIVEGLREQNRKLFAATKSYLLTNEKATVRSITDALHALSAITDNDVAVIFMAGHGIRDENGTFYFLTSEGSVNNPRKGGLSWSLLVEYLGKIKGRVIVFLDACHSGSIVYETVVPNDELAEAFFKGKRGGVMVFSASKGRQFSLESPDIGGGFGIFTYALTQGMGPKSREVDVNENGYVELMELVEYVSRYVNEETNGQQTPWLSRKEFFGDLPIAAVH